MDETRRAAPVAVGVVLAGLGALWLMAAPVLGHMGRPWPCFFFGAAILASTVLAWKRPRQRRGWSVLVVALSAASMLLGAGSFVPAFLGLAGGALLLSGIGSGAE